MLDGRRLGLASGGGGAHGVARELRRELADGAVERGGEEERLALAAEQRDDALDRGLEADVEHAVDLVQDEHRHVVEPHQAARDEVLEPARRRDDDVAAGRGLALA